MMLVDVMDVPMLVDVVRCCICTWMQVDVTDVGGCHNCRQMYWLKNQCFQLLDVFRMHRMQRLQSCLDVIFKNALFSAAKAAQERQMSVSLSVSQSVCQSVRCHFF